MKNVSVRRAMLSLCLEQILPFLSRVLSRGRAMGGMQLLHLIAVAIAIVGLFAALEYFTGRASLRTTFDGSMHHIRSARYSVAGLADFYAENSLKIPDVLDRYISSKSRSFDLNAPPYNVHAPDLDWVRFFNNEEDNNENANQELAYRIDMLERTMEEYECKALVFMYRSDGFYDEKAVKKLLNAIRPELTDKDYYFFLAGLIYSRQIAETSFITNNGDLDLSQLEIRIASPFSRIARNRNNNIMDIELSSLIPHSINRDAREAVIRLPILRKGESITLRTVTRENRISTSDITYTYKETRMLNKKRIACTSLIVFPAVILLPLIWPGKKNINSN